MKLPFYALWIYGSHPLAIIYIYNPDFECLCAADVYWVRLRVEIARCRNDTIKKLAAPVVSQRHNEIENPAALRL